MSNSLTPWTVACHAPLSSTMFWSLLKFMSIESVMSSNHLIICHPVLLPSVFPSFGVFSKQSALRIKWPKYWSFNFSISPSNKYLGFISLGLTGLISLLSKGLSRVFVSIHNSKVSPKKLLITPSQNCEVLIILIPLSLRLLCLPYFSNA